MGRAVKSAAGLVAKLGLAAGAVALGGLALILKANLKSIDSLAKLSRNLGISIDKLQGLRMAAEIAGVGSDKLDKSLKKLTKAVFDAGKGLSTAIDAFEVLGIKAADLEGMDVGQVFDIVADAVKRTGQSMETTGALMDIFGAKMGTDMVELLRQGAEGLDTFRQEIEDMGLSLSAVDAAKVEAANDAWTRFKGILKAVAQRITVELAPFIEAAVEALTAMGKSGDGAGGIIRNAMEFAAKAIAFVANVVQRFALGFQVLGDVAIDVLQLQLTGLTAVAKGIEWVLDRLGLVDAGWTKHLDNMKDKLQEVEDGLKRGIADNLDSIAAGGWGKKITDKFDAIRDAAQAAAEEATKLGDAVEDPKLPESLEPTIDKVEELAEKVLAVADPVKAKGFQAGRFAGEGDLSLRAGSESFREEQTDNRRVEELLQRILDVNLAPPPQPLVWSE